MVTIYIEGGGDSDYLRTRCRQAFSTFFERAGFKGCMPKPRACGSRTAAFKKFKTACKRGEEAVLLVDSEAPVTETSAWEHLRKRPGDLWEKPAKATDEDCQLMVQCMEAWFLVDKELLERFFKEGFYKGRLPARVDIENISKDDAQRYLSSATEGCDSKGRYDKGEHSFDLLELVDPVKVAAASPWARRLLRCLAARLGVERWGESA